MSRSLAAVCFAAAAALCGCVTLPTVALTHVPDDVGALRAANTFYAATTPAALAAALAAARDASPDAAVTHELEFRYAQLLGRDDEALTSLLAALRDTNDDAAMLHLQQLSWLDVTQAQRPVVEAHLVEL